MTDTYYHFISFGRQGLAAAIDKDPVEKQKRASIELLLNVARKSKPTGKWDETNVVKRTVQLYGPGDVIGFDERIVARTDPRPDSGNFEPNYFPLIEFADFDFPWRYSPEPADEDEDKGLTPWIVLIALIAEGQEQEYEQVARGSDQVPVIKVFDQRSLPNLENAWRWAHVQATSGSSGQEGLTYGQLTSIYENQPECLVSRLLCTRRLQPKTLYTAFIVPAFKLGWAAGLGDEIALRSVIESTANDLAWKNEDQASESIELPYYYRWDFRTSLRGDFEHLVRLLEPRELKGLGLRKMDCQHPGFGLSVQRSDPENEGENHILELEGALQSYDTNYTPWGKDKNGPLDSLEPEEYPEPEEFQERLAVEVLSKANPESLIRSCKVNPAIAAAEGSEGTHKSDAKTTSSASQEEIIAEEVINHISFNALPDGKSVRVRWRTPGKTTGRISYGAEKSPGRVTYDHICSSDTYARQHSVIIQLAPEKIYWLKLRIINRKVGIDFDAISASLCIPLPAVVPPIYGRWHAACSNVDPNKYTKDWLNVLNLDPRHRAAAGLGAEVVRKQQEALMASAWDQIGDIESVNDILRRAQQSRESSNFLYDRLGAMTLEDYLQVTAPVQKRVIRDQDDDSKQTIRTELEKTTLIPPAALDPAFRRISRARGPIRKRQKQRRTDLLRRMATGEFQPAGEPPKIMGTKTPCDITKEMLRDIGIVPTISFDKDKVKVELESVDQTSAETKKFESYDMAMAFSIYELALRFCDELITCDDLRRELKKELEKGVEGVSIEDDLLEAICDAFSNFLVPEEETDQPPTRKQPYLEDLRNSIHAAIDPRKTIVERVKRRLKLTGELAKRFEEDAKGDPLDEIMAYPVFPQPMYVPLRELSESHILPGVEKVPQNTVSVLETNRRFLESYMVGLNHEFSAELLWRGFPTDQRGSYFRQFWDVSEHIDSSGHLSEEEQIEAPEHLKDIRPLTQWKKSQLGKNNTRSIGNDANSSENGNRAVLIIRGDLLKRYPNAVIYAVNARLEYNQEGKPTGNFIPDLDEYNLESLPAAPIFPTFQGSLGADLVYFGFPFSIEEAKSSSETTGKFFIFEERITETRFGLDLGEENETENTITIQSWDNLSWEVFQLADEPGKYLDSSPIQKVKLEDDKGEMWDDNASAAFRARVTMQKPVRLAVHADQMIPEPAKQ